MTDEQPVIDLNTHPGIRSFSLTLSTGETRHYERAPDNPIGSDDVTVSLADDRTWYAFRDLLHIDPVSLEGV